MNLLSVCWTYCQSVTRTRIRNERGASLVEYALLLALIAIVCIGAITLIGQTASNKLSETASALQ